MIPYGVQGFLAIPNGDKGGQFATDCPVNSTRKPLCEALYPVLAPADRKGEKYQMEQVLPELTATVQ